MAKKNKISYICQNCGCISLKWVGKCPECGEWDSFEQKDETDYYSGTKASVTPAAFTHVDEVDITESERIVSTYTEFDRIIGGGVVKGSYNLLSGHPGVGKSTLMLQLAYDLSKRNHVLYISGEESTSQVKLRFQRFRTQTDTPNLFLSNENNLDRIKSMIDKETFDILFIDSIQTVFTSEVSGIPGSVSQIKECAVRLLEIAKKKGITLFVIGHVTKSGNIAGPMLLEHMVDTVLLFEGDPTIGYRVLRTTKNRFGATDEIGIFTMTSEGLVEVDNPSQFFVSQETTESSGSCRALILEGSRPFLIEVQSLATSSTLPQPRRVVTGIDSGRLSMITAILEKRGDLFFSNFDLFVNVVGGLKLKTPASDLPIAASLLSALFNISIPHSVAFIGELGLGGEIRDVPGIDLMIREGERLGVKKIYIPKTRTIIKENNNIEIIALHSIFQLIEEIRSMNIFE